ncbi:hypothetical protein NLG97_g2821 [Lecanicillium saksenae]|uniref:Uncharacterized protein n=1 Tax=Lecanicillium saksenae TaxID=468837 RepID=A0ACC1R187_9HYPO|nr:hypothetical protein NLG97_g2821 [Lecanicillium saksenae]
MTIPKLGSLINYKKVLKRFRKGSQETAPPVIPQPLYRIRSITCSNAEKDPLSFSVWIRFNGKIFSVIVELLRLKNSPNRQLEFHQFYQQLSMGEICSCDSDDEEEDCNSPATHRMGLYDCVDWAVTPCLDAFRTKAPPLPSAEPLTLKQRYSREAYQCHLNADNERLEPGVIFMVSIGGAFVPERSRPPTPEVHPRLSEVFPCFPLSEIEYPELDPSAMFDYEPRFVRVGDQDYLFKPYETEHNHAMQEVRKHEHISQIHGGAEVRFWRLFGIAQNQHGSAAGLLFHPIDGMLLPEALERCQTDEIKGQWTKKITATVNKLHANHISWGLATADNIVIDSEGEPWLIDFPTDIYEQWVDMDSSTAINADRDSLHMLINYIDGM